MKQIKVYITAEQWAEKRLQIYLTEIGQSEIKSRSERETILGILDSVIIGCGFELIEPETKPEQPQPTEIPTDKVEAVKYFLNQLPDGYRERALAQLDKKHINSFDFSKSIEDATRAFNEWSKTKEGLGFWLKVNNHYRFPEEYPTLPPLPND